MFDNHMAEVHKWYWLNAEYFKNCDSFSVFHLASDP